jgi:hypothetical protein
MAARNGAIRVNASHAETTAQFVGVHRQYEARGFTHADYDVLDVRSAGANSVVATVRWAYKNAANATIWKTTFTYNLYRRDGALKILIHTMHDA